MDAKRTLTCPVVATLATAAFAVALVGRWSGEEPTKTINVIKVQTQAATSQLPTAIATFKPRSAKERFQRAQELAQEGEAAVPELAQLLDQGTEDPRILTDALAMIGSGEAVLAVLKKILNETDINTRQQLAESLRNVTDANGLETLLSATAATERPEILEQAIEAAGRMATPESVEYLIELYRSNATIMGQHRKVAVALAHIQSSAVTRQMASLARTATEPGLVEAAALSLAKTGSTTALQGLMDTLNAVGQSDQSLRQSLLVMLERAQSPTNEAYRNTLLADAEQSADILAALQSSQH